MNPPDNLLVERAGAVVTVSMNRPKALNALDAKTIDELGNVVRELSRDKAVRAVILTGAGEKAFVAGADIAAMVEYDKSAGRAFSERGHAVFASIEAAPQPWIAAVNGFALGGGLELALACDFIYASKTAKLGQPEVNLGVIPGFGGTQRLAQRVGIAKARELLYTGATIGADEALRLGLAQAVFEPAELMPAARKTAETIAQKAPFAVGAVKRVVRLGADETLPAACALEAEFFGEMFATKDLKEGMRAFLEKRAAVFSGE